MVRQVDRKKTRKALRRLRRAAELAEGPDGPGLNPWEKEFVEGVSQRLETYGSAFRDPGKGQLDDALSHRQAEIVRALRRKARKSKDRSAERRSPSSADPSKDEDEGPSSAERFPPASRSRLKAGASLRRSGRSKDGPAETASVSPPVVMTAEDMRARLRLIAGGRRPDDDRNSI